MTIFTEDTNNDGHIDGTGIPVLHQDLVAAVQGPALDAIVEMFSINLTKLGGDIFHFVNGVASDGTHIHFGGVEHFPLVFETSGWEVSTSGAAPRPKIKLSSVTGTLFNAVENADDLVNCEIIRTRTFRKYLDDGTEPNPNIYFPKDIYRIERKVSANRVYIEFELSSVFDNSDKQIPGRKILKNYCSHIYRRWDSNLSAFDYTEATCQYSGVHCFDSFGNKIEDQSLDTCGKQLSDCKARFSVEFVPETIQFAQATPPEVFNEGDYWLSTYQSPNRLYQAKGSFYSIYYKGSTGTPPNKDNAYFPYGDGDHWVDAANNRLWRYETPIGQPTENYNWYEKTVIASATQPTGMADGQYWHDTTNDLWYAYDLKFYIESYNELPFRAFPGAGGLGDS